MSIAPAIHIRLCDETDLDLLVELARTTFVEAFWDTNAADSMIAYMESAFQVEVFRQEMKQPDARFFLVSADETPAGYLKLNRSGAQSDVRDPESLEVERIYVLADYQGKGIGQILLEYAVETAKAEDLKYLWLGVWEYNEKAQAFYRKNGFRTFGSHPFVMGEEVQTDLLMRREVYLT